MPQLHEVSASWPSPPRAKVPVQRTIPTHADTRQGDNTAYEVLLWNFYEVLLFSYAAR